jgi:aspartate aminotransferase-like enzyme
MENCEMSFIECADMDDAEKIASEKKACFVSPDDFRIYDSIEFWDDASIMEIPAKTLLHLYNLQVSIQANLELRDEMGFNNVVERAQELNAAFNKVLEAIKFSPIKRKARP